MINNAINSALNWGYININIKFTTSEQSKSIPAIKGKREALCLTYVEGAPYMSRALHLTPNMKYSGAHNETSSGQLADFYCRIDWTNGMLYFKDVSCINLTTIMQGILYR